MIVPNKTVEADDPPADGYGAGYLAYQLRTDFRALRSIVGFENARQVVAEIINDDAERKRQ